MTDPVKPVIDALEASGQRQGSKAWAWLKVHWYAAGIGAAAGAIVGHLFWK